VDVKTLFTYRVCSRQISHRRDRKREGRTAKAGAELQTASGSGGALLLYAKRRCTVGNSPLSEVRSWNVRFCFSFMRIEK